MELSNVLFPNGYHRQDIEQNIKKTIELSIFSDYFSTESDLINFINKFSKTEDAENFLNAIYLLYLLQTANNPLLRLILRIAILERLGGSSSYRQFHIWFNKLDETKYQEIVKCESFIPIMNIKDFKDRITILGEYYLTEHGAIKAVKKILNENLGENDKIRLIASFTSKRGDYFGDLISLVTVVNQKYPQNPIDLTSSTNLQDVLKKIKQKIQFDGIGDIKSDGFFPECYDYRFCSVSGPRCHLFSNSKHIENCQLKNNPDLLQKEINRIVNILYKMRSAFVHKAEQSYSDNVDFFVTEIDGKEMVIELQREKFDKLIKKCVYKYFIKVQRSEKLIQPIKQPKAIVRDDPDK